MLRVLTIGHSNHAMEHFLGLLKQHHVEVVADTRSQPFSRYSPHFNGDRLRHALVDSEIQYVFLGNELGGRPQGDQFYDEKGRVLYEPLALSSRFLAGLTRLEQGLIGFNVALLCSEESPAVCHRRLLVGRALVERGIAVDHILGDGRLQSEEELSLEEAAEQAEMHRKADAVRRAKVESRAEADRRAEAERIAKAVRRADTARQGVSQLSLF